MHLKSSLHVKLNGVERQSKKLKARLDEATV